MSGKCSECKDAINKFAPDNSSSIAHYQQWRSVDNRMEKVDITGTVEECFLELEVQVWPFLLHTYVKRKQSASFKSLVMAVWLFYRWISQKTSPLQANERSNQLTGIMAR